MRLPLFAPFQSREPPFHGGLSLLDCSRGIARKHALDGKDARQYVEAHVRLIEARVRFLAKRVELLAIIGEFPTELLEQAQRAALGFGHVESGVRQGENRSDAE